MKSSYIILTTVIAAALLGACATGPNPKIEDARTTLQRSEKDPDIAQAAPAALREAKKNIHRAQAAYENGDDAAIDHYAYLANAQLEIASTQAEDLRLQKQVESADEQRKELALRAQQEKTISAQQSAATAQQEAAAARQQAAKLESQLRDLQAKRTERGIVLTLGDVLFDTAKANLKIGGLRTVDKLADFMNEYPQRRVRIEGHTDSRGSNEYNQQLSLQRAQTVHSGLISRGIDPGRISSVGLGEAYPKASNDTSAGRQQNRRVEIIISDDQGRIKSRNQF